MKKSDIIETIIKRTNTAYRRHNKYRELSEEYAGAYGETDTLTRVYRELWIENTAIYNELCQLCAVVGIVDKPEDVFFYLTDNGYLG